MRIEINSPLLVESRRFIRDTFKSTGASDFSLRLLNLNIQAIKVLSDASLDCSMFTLFNHLSKFSPNSTEGMEKLKTFVEKLPEYSLSNPDETYPSTILRVHNILLKSIVLRYETEGEKCESVLVKFTEKKEEK